MRTYRSTNNLIYKNIEADSNKKVVFLSGLGMNIRRQREGFIRRFALCQGVSYLALDYTKFTQSGTPEDDYKLKEATEATASLLKASKEKDIYLCGACYGGMLALRLASKMPHRVKGVIVSSPAYETSEYPWIEQADQFLAKRIETLKKRSHASPALTQMVAFRQLVIHAFKTQGRTPIASTYQGPLQILHGQNDRFIPAENSSNVLKALKNKQASLALIEKTGHTISSDYEMKAYIKILKGFMNQKT